MRLYDSQPVLVPAKTAVLLLFMPPAHADRQQRASLIQLTNTLQDQLGGQVRVLRIEKAVHPEVVRSFGITQTPAFVLVQQGVEIWRLEGEPDAATIALITQRLLA